MLPYSRISGILDEVSRAGGRKDKIGLVASFLEGLPSEVLCPSVRLLTGELWPCWKPRGAGVGPESVAYALAGLVGKATVSGLREEVGEMGLVAERALYRSSQHTLTSKPLDAVEVYRELQKIIMYRGPSSRGRIVAGLRGLLIGATPLEGKYIARTLMGNMMSGLGPFTLLQAIAKASTTRIEDVRRGYQLLPEPGLVALEAFGKGLRSISVTPTIPLRPMLIVKVSGYPLPGERPRGDHSSEGLHTEDRLAAADQPVPALYQLWYGGLRVQLHKADGKFSVYSSRSRDITPSLNGLLERLASIDCDLVVEAELLGFKEGRLVRPGELVRFINRRHLSRRSSLRVCLKATDLLFLDGRDFTPMGHRERWDALVATLEVGDDLPYPPISLAKAGVISDARDLEAQCSRVRELGFRGLLLRRPEAPYTPGEVSRSDYLLRVADKSSD